MLKMLKPFPIVCHTWGRMALNPSPINSVPGKIRLISFENLRPIPIQVQKPSLTHVNQSGEAHMVSISDKEVTSRTAIARCEVHFSSPLAEMLITNSKIRKGDVLASARIAGIMAAKRAADLIPLCHSIQISQVTISLRFNQPPLNVAPGVRARASDANGASEVSQPWAGTGRGDAYEWSSSTTSAPEVAKAEERREDAPQHAVSSQEGHHVGPPADKSTLGWLVIEAKISSEGKTGVEMEALTAASVAALTVYDMCKGVDTRMEITGLRVVHKKGGRSGTWKNGVSVD